MIKIQQPFREMPLAVNKSKMSYLYLLFVVMKNVLKEMLIKTFQHYRKNLCSCLVPLKQFCLDHGSLSKVPKSHSFDRHHQNTSQKHIKTFSLCIHCQPSLSWFTLSFATVTFSVDTIELSVHIAKHHFSLFTLSVATATISVDTIELGVQVH